MLDRKDDAFRRFLERATDDPDGADVAPLSMRAAAPQRPYRVLLAVAAGIVVLIGAFVLTRRSPTAPVATRPPVASADDTTVLPTASAGNAGATTVAVSTGTSNPTATATPVGGPAPVDPATTAAASSAPATVEPPASGTTPPAKASPVVPPAATTAPAPAPPRLRLDLAAVAPGAGNGATVQPAIGPALHVEQAGSGAITTAVGVPGGRSFVPGGQQRTDYAVLTRVGADVAALAPPSGRVTIGFTSLGDLDARVSPAGRNIHTWYELVASEGPANVVTGVSLQIDPEIGPYFSVVIQGTHGEFTLSAAERVAFAAGRPVTVTLDWTATTGRLLLDGRTLLELPLSQAPIAWDATARVAIGGSATYGGGYFSIHDDALTSIEISDTRS